MLNIPLMSKQDDIIKQMNIELETLQKNIEQLSNLTKESATQFQTIKKFGIQQSSFFMSAHNVFQQMNDEREHNSK